jgi:hypothetical protein
MRYLGFLTNFGIAELIIIIIILLYIIFIIRVLLGKWNIKTLSIIGISLSSFFFILHFIFTIQSVSDYNYAGAAVFLPFFLFGIVYSIFGLIVASKQEENNKQNIPQQLNYIQTLYEKGIISTGEYNEMKENVLQMFKTQ